MDDKSFDEFVKGKALEEKTLLPSGLNQKMTTTFKELPKRKKYHTRLLRLGSVAAILAFCVLTSIGFASPTFATNVPILNNVFEFLHSQNLIGDEYSRYSNNIINQTQTDKGLTISINQVLYDGINISVGYVIKSDHKIENPYLIDKVIKLNGAEMNLASGGSSSPKDNYTVAVIENFIVGEKNLPKDFNMQLKINDIDGISGEWNFKFPVSLGSTKDQIKQIQVGKDLSHIRAGLILDKMIITPITTAFSFHGKNDDARVEYMLFDNEGKQIQAEGISINGSNGNTFEQYQFAALKQSPKYLTLIPYQFEYVKSGEEKYIKEDLNLKYPIVIPGGKMGDLIVEDVAFKVDTTEIRFKLGNLTPSLLGEYMFVEDSKGEKISINRFNANPINGSPNEFIAQIKPLKNDEKYKIGVLDLKDRLKILEDQRIIVPLGK